MLSFLFLSLALVLSSALGQFPSGFDFQLYGTQWAEADAFAQVLPSNLSTNAYGTNESVPAGEIYIWGASFGEAVLPTYNSASATPPANVSTVGLAYSTGAYGGDTGCANRAGANRFYLIGTNESIGAATDFNDYWFVFASNDGVTWSNVLDSATKQAWLARFNDDNTLCVVDLQGNVYSVGSATTWKSANQGVTWTQNSDTATRFSNRTYFAGGIFTSAITKQDKIMVIGGRQAPAASNTYYGGNDLNDVYSSSDLGQTWVLVTAAAPFQPRDAFSWAASQSGAMVVFGGSLGNGYAGYLGDLWYSADDGATWSLVVAQTSIGNFSLTSMVFDLNGYLYLFGGQGQRTENGVVNQYDWLKISAVSTVALGGAAPSAPSSSTGSLVVGSSAAPTTPTAATSAPNTANTANTASPTTAPTSASSAPAPQPTSALQASSAPFTTSVTQAPNPTGPVVTGGASASANCVSLVVLALLSLVVAIMA